MPKEVIFITTKFNSTDEQPRVRQALEAAQVPFMDVNGDLGYWIWPTCPGKPAICVRDAITKTEVFRDCWSPDHQIDVPAVIAAFNA